jgi:hypothetical protein
LLLLVGEDASQALEVSTGAVRINHHVANSPPSVKEEGNLQEFIDSNPFTQLGSTQIEAEESQALHMNNTDSIAENDMGESRDNSRKAFGVSQTMDAELQRYNSTLSGVMGTENSTQADGGDEETESQKRVEKQFGDKKDKKDRKERKKDKKDRKERKKEKHDKHNDPEYLEKKRKRKEEREQRRGQEGHKSSKEEKHRKEDRSVKVEEKSASDAPINDYLQPEGTKIENQGGTDTMKIKFKFKKPRTAT